MARTPPASIVQCCSAPAVTADLRVRASLDACMARLAEGDRAAFECVFHALWPVLSRFCASLLKHEQDAADAAQEALHKIFERASDYDRRRPALAWALAIASWECRSVQRKRARRREVYVDAPEAPAVFDHDEAHVRRDLTQAALVALAALSERDRAALIASFLEEAVAVPAATLRKRRERALQRLKGVWRRLYGFD
jgi:RNA polymerase sigma-70 factor (ECF subfamily)